MVIITIHQSKIVYGLSDCQYALKFGDYYRSAELWNPPRLDREWMLAPFEITNQ